MTQTRFTVEKLLRLPIMQDAKVVGGFEGMVHEINCVDVMEIPDVSGWLRKGEFILTTGYSFRTNPDVLCQMIEEMHRVGGAAIGFKPKRFLEATPPQAIQLSNKYHIPLIEIPPAIPYIEITQPIMEQILDSQLTMMREIYKMNDRFVELLVTERGQELLDVLGRLLSCQAALLTFAGGLELRTAGFRMEDVKVIREICSGNRALASVALTREIGSGNVFEEMCLAQVVSLMSLDLTAKGLGTLQGERAREQFLVELLSGHLPIEPVLVQRAKQLGWPMGTSWAVLLLECECKDGASVTKIVEDKSKPSSIHEEALHFINLEYSKKAVATHLGRQVAVAYALTDRGASKQEGASLEFAYDLKDILELQFGITFRGAIGESRQKLGELVGSYKEAIRALDVSKQLGNAQSVVQWADIYVEEILLNLGENPTISKLCKMLILPINQYDQENGTDLFRTLDTYLRCGGNTKFVADQLFIHRNSVHYRLERIQDILGVDLSNPETSFRLNLSVRAWKLGLGRHGDI